MPRYVIAYPVLSAADCVWVDDLRARFDPVGHRLVAPHVTLVFATELLDVDELAAHVAAVARAFPPFACVFRGTAVVREADAYCVFIVPDEGHAEVERLHDALYQGRLAPELRHDLPYLPHLTVARCDSEPAARGLATSASGLELSSRIEALTVIAIEDGQLTSTRRILL